jgi:cysteine sulfinate desulfinase/cysteine desulfurase-like protein
MRLAVFSRRAAFRAGGRAGIPVHTDAVQAVGRIPVNFHDLSVTPGRCAPTVSRPGRGGRLAVRRGVSCGPGFMAALSSKEGAPEQ